MRSYKYILNGMIPVPEPDILKWAEWYEASLEDGRRVVQQTAVGEGYMVSTIFTGLDMGLMFDDSPPVLFETAVFRDLIMEDIPERYSTWQQAEQGHGRVVAQFVWYCEECSTMNPNSLAACSSCGHKK